VWEGAKRKKITWEKQGVIRSHEAMRRGRPKTMMSITRNFWKS
jgi:hypothetical protein